MTTQELVNYGCQAAPYAGAVVGGVALQRIFNIVSMVAGFFASKPNVVPALLEVVKDLKEGQKDLQADLMALLAALRGVQANAAKSN